jgi:hypothetical protein
MKGKLQDMAVADLIQLNCQDRKTARAVLRNGGQRGELYFKNGNVVHAEVGDVSGEQAAYKMMNWDQGNFDVIADVDPPTISITRSWTSLLLEAARLSDEVGEEEKVAAALAELEPTRGSDQKFVDIIQEFSVLPPQELLQQFSEKIEGHRLSCLTQVRGNALYWYASGTVELEELMEQVNQFVKMVETTTNKLGAGALQDNLLTTDDAYLLIRFLGRENFYIFVVADKAKANLGNLRHQARTYTDRFISALKLEGTIV